MLYVNVYQLAGQHQFVGNMHASRGVADEAARVELHFERNTRRIGVLRIHPKEGVRD